MNEESGGDIDRLELQDRDIPDLHIPDRTHLRRLNRMYGRARVVGWLRAKVALPTRLELDKMSGEEVDEDVYYEALADRYVDTGTDHDGGGQA